MVKNQKGFTLVEIAIVLVIIGLLLGGVLKGQELIQQSKIKRVVNDFNSITAAIYTYQDRYRFLPGDDSLAAGRWPVVIGGTAAATNGNGNGVINATLAQIMVGGANEGGNAWQHLRASGLVTGAVNTLAISRTPELTPFNSNYGIGTSVAVYGFGTAPVFCASIPPKAAEQLDRQLDDGVPGSGTIRAGAPSATVNSAPTGVAVAAGTTYVDNPATPWYTVCKQF